MALKIELDARAKKMESILAEVNAALSGKNAAEAESFSGIAAAIAAIEKPEVRLQDKNIVENGVYTADSGYDGLGTVNVSIAGGELEAGIIYDEITSEGKVIRARVLGSAMPQYAFAGQDELVEVDIPDKLNIIRASSFYTCRTLPFVALSDDIAIVESNSFYDCRELALTALPASLTSIGISAFYRCMKLTITEIPAGVTKISGNAFNNCTGLTSITFRGTPESIAATAFNNCSGLKAINVPWAEGTVANAPWGATAATINYNYTGE